MAADSKGSKTVRVADFELRKKLGQGGMGTVYLAHQISLDRDCAVKVLSKDLAAKPGFVERFIREARAMAKVDHPGVVACYAVGEEKGHHFVAMELMDGRSMQDWLNHLQRIPVADALLVAIIAGEALHYAHEKNMIHRDIKPDNLLVTKKGVVKVADLGLAKAVDDIDMSLTQSGTGLGTPHYMPPEQARNAKHVDRRCDVYALGSTLYHFVTGRLPFAGDSIVELITNKERGQFTPARQLNKEVPERLSLMIDRAMAKDPKSRYQTCEDFVRDLESLGLANESLGFIEADDKVILRRGGGPATMSGGQRTMAGYQAQKRSAQAIAAQKRSAQALEAQKRSASTYPPEPAELDAYESNGKADWFVKHKDAKGQAKIEKLTTAQVLKGIKGDVFNEQVQAASTAKGPFLPLAQIPVFKSELGKMLTRQGAKKRDDNLAAQYEKLAKQYERRKWWDLFRRFKDGTLGMVGLIIWLAVVAAIGYGLYLVVPMLWDQIAQNVGLGDTDPTAPTGNLNPVSGQGDK